MPFFPDLFILDAIVKASILLGLTVLISVGLRRASAASRHLVWTLGLAGALVAPLLSIAIPRWEVPLVQIAAAVVDAPREQRGSLPPEGRSYRVATDPPKAPELRKSADLPTTTNVPTTASSPTSAASGVPMRARMLANLSWPTMLMVLWSIGAAAIVGRMILGLVAVAWISRRTSIVTDAPWLLLARTLAKRLGLSAVRFLRSRTASMPMAWGILRPSILMPANADIWPEERLRIVLLHELAHVRRRDCLTHLFAQVACAVYWFNPLAWIAVRRLRTERERACDDLVLASGTRGADYADQLLEIARDMRAGRFPAVLAGASLAMAHRSQLEGRLIAILDPTVPRKGVTRLRAAAALGLFVMLIVPVASVQPWAKESVSISSDAAIAALPPQSTQPVVSPEPRMREQQPDTPAAAATPDLAEPIDKDVANGIREGIRGGVTGGVPEGIAGGVSGGVGGGISGGVVESVRDAVGTAVDMRLQDEKKEGSRASDPRTVNALIEALKDSDKEVRETALSALAQMRDPRVFEPLVSALKDSSPSVRQQAAFGLGQLRDERAVEPLSAALKDAAADVREQAAFALGQLRARSAVAALGAALKDSDADVREQAVFALGQIRDASAIDAIAVALHDVNASVREQAAFALGQIQDRRAVEPLISALKDEKPDVREQAAFALGQLRDARAVEALVIALKDANADVREQTAFALGQIRDARAIDALTAALKDANASVRQQAAFALGQIR